MQCDICFRTGGKAFLCPTDARNLLYEPRIRTARILLEKDALDQQVTTLLQNSTAGDDGSSSKGPVSSPLISNLDIERDQAVERTQQIIAHADELRAKVQNARDEIAKKKAVLARRRSELASATSGTDVRRARQVEEVEKSIRMTKYKWNKSHSKSAGARTFLCGEAAKLYGLKRIRKNGTVEEYKIGGVSIMDLRSLNTSSPAQISTALSHIAHLLLVSTHYLSIRLPAEITLPHRDYPLPTIFPLLSSHKHADIPFPGTTPSQSSNTSPTASRHGAELVNQPRPRPLFIKKPLPMLATEDPAGYSLFLEAVTLLAYDVAWLCRSQGIPVGEDDSFEDICHIGRNLYNVLIGTKPRPQPSSRVPSNQSTPTKNGLEVGNSELDDKKATVLSIMGRYSHGSAHTFLGSADGTEFIRSWKLLSPTKITDQLKTKLMSEVANAEWELLNEDAWSVDKNDEVGGEGVVVGAKKDGGRYALGMQSFMSMKTVMDAVEMIGGDGERRQNVSGWTKLKPR